MSCLNLQKICKIVRMFQNRCGSSRGSRSIQDRYWMFHIRAICANGLQCSSHASRILNIIRGMSSLRKRLVVVNLRRVIVLLWSCAFRGWCWMELWCRYVVTHNVVMAWSFGILMQKEMVRKIYRIIVSC